MKMMHQFSSPGWLRSRPTPWSNDLPKWLIFNFCERAHAHLWKNKITKKFFFSKDPAFFVGHLPIPHPLVKIWKRIQIIREEFILLHIEVWLHIDDNKIRDNSIIFLMPRYLVKKGLQRHKNISNSLFLIFETETISRTDVGQPRPKYIFNKCETNIFLFYSTEVCSITITEF